ncbi:DUF5719 family protein [Streptomyces sp. NPDC005438]|uniref:DUF5719 family protein n=1 Tax=Streptomyces sp. NPDC005438 TaxID=3156880 RepID=UPI0033ACC806
MNRTTMALGGAAVSLTLLTGVAALAAPSDSDEAGPATRRLPVERTTLVCPQPTDSEVAQTTYTGFSPSGGGSTKGQAELLPVDDAENAGDEGGKDKKDKKEKKKGKKKPKKPQPDKPVVPLKEPGAPVKAERDKANGPALVGTAEGRFAPGWTVQQTTLVRAGDGRGALGTACSVPDTEFTFPGASTAEDRQDYVHLTNPDDTGAVVDLELHGKEGRLDTPSGEGVNVPPRSTVPVLLSSLTSKPSTNVTLHVTSRSGRVGALVRASDEKLGGDWISAAGDARPSAVLPGIPGDAKEVRLMVYAPGEQDADLKLKLAGKSGSITPAGHETLHVKGGMTTAVDLGPLTRGQAGSLVLTPSGQGGQTPVVAALRVVRGKGQGRESAFVTSTPPLAKRATAADNRAKGGELSLTAPEKAVRVRITASKGTAGGTASSTTVTVRGGTTTAMSTPKPKGGKGSYAVTVERLSGGQLYAARTLKLPLKGVSAFTTQTLPDDQSTVAVPSADQDLSVLHD